MSRFNGRTVRLLSGLGVFLAILILFCYHELVSETPYIPSSLNYVTEKLSKGSNGDAKNTTESTGPSQPSASASTTAIPDATPTPTPTPYAGDPELLANATRYVDAIMNPENSTFDVLSCPGLDTKRYAHLKATSEKPSYFFALDFREQVDLLPRLMGSMVEVIRFLGPKHCVVSIVEGNSKDGSFEVLKLLGPELEGFGAKYHFVRSDIDPSAGNRIGALAELRNLAVEPLTEEPLAFSIDTTVIFLNDVAACPEDILELVHSRKTLGADMTCGFDWTYVGRDPTFYDVWISRTMQGDSFFEIPPDGNWNSAWNLFWNAPDDRARYSDHKPFQVYSCWNGAAIFAAKPLWDEGVRFRSSVEGECFQGEPQLFCKDLWYAGHGKIAVVPSVNFEYDDEKATRIKKLKGYTSQWTGEEDESWGIEWVENPPEKVKCMASYGNQEWRPWDEKLPGVET